MSHDCSVCSSASVDVVNTELLKPKHEKRMTLRELASLSGLTRSSLGRHSLRCIPRLRLALNRDKLRTTASSTYHRQVVSWPPQDGKPAYFTYYDEVLRESDLRPDDILLVVSFTETDIRAIGNPRGLTASRANIEKLHELAILENAERAKLQDASAI